MDIKSVVKKELKAIWIKRGKKKIKQRIYRDLKKQIALSDTDIQKLSEEQIKEIRAFWSRNGIENIPLDWHKLLYSITGKQKPEFIPEIIFQQIVRPAMNDYTFAGVWSDKAYIDYFIRGVKTARSIVRNVNGRFLDEHFNLITIQEAQTIVDQYMKLVIKPSTYTDTGKGVCLLSAPFNLPELVNKYKKNFVIQLPLKQHSDMSKLNPSSINTIRINSVLFETEAHVMSAFVKVGQMGEFADNSGKERYFIGIHEDGSFFDYAIDHDLNRYKKIPSGYDFANQKIPCYDKVCRAIEKAHKCIPHFGLAFWDVCVNEDGEPVIVEVNLRYPDGTIPQAAGNPFLGKYTKEVMEYIKQKK